MDIELTSFASVTAAADYCSPYVEAAAETKRRTYIPDGQLQTHLMRYTQSADYVAASYPYASAADYPLLLAAAQNYYGTTSPSSGDVQTMADSLKSQGDAYYGAGGILSQIEFQRGRIVDLYTRSDYRDCLSLTSDIVYGISLIS